jgi:hypothetical protein
MGLGLRRICGLHMRLRRLRDVGLGRLILPGNDLWGSIGTGPDENLYPLVLHSYELIYTTRDSMYKDIEDPGAMISPVMYIILPERES